MTSQLYLLSLLGTILHLTFCQDQIFFPRQEQVTEPPCIAYDGRQGHCRLLAQCATFFAEIAELSRSPCAINQQQSGVCCPPNKQQTKDPVSVIAKIPEHGNIAITFPSVTVQDLNNAAEKGLEAFAQKQEFAQDLVDRNIIAPANSPEFWHSRLFETTDAIVKKGDDATIVLGASKDLTQSFNLDKNQVEDGLPKFSVIDTVIKNTCPPPPGCPDPKHNYRTIDGTCNNLKFKTWGSAGEPFTRMVAPEYQDGLSVPRQSVANQPLPSARAVSIAVAPSSREIYNNLTILIWQWGQFLDHDITHTPISKGAKMADISCCSRGQVRPASDLHPECFPIDIPPDDSFYSKFKQGCMEFVRSMAAIRPQCRFGPREQMNQITSYIDASNVYGSSDNEAAKLRAFQKGELKVTIQGNRELLPGSNENIGCVSKSTVEQCFVAGDTRVNEQPDLTVVHTVWVRQHNKIVRELARLNPSWSDEVLYHEGRRIVGAQLQHITYNEYLPIVLGREFMESFGLLPQKRGFFGGYRGDVDATIVNSFATAAFRYGHTLVTDHLQGFGKFGNLKMDDEISRTQFLPFSLYEPETLDSLIRGLSLQQSQKFDRFFSDQITNKLFAQSREFGMDLVALNIQRGRDHGLPPYTKWREVCQLPPINSWQDLAQIVEPQAVARLSEVYANVHDLDLFVAGVSENNAPGTLLGPTFLCIIGRQFIKLKIGDRFFYENGIPRAVLFPGESGGLVSSFTESQLDEIRKTTLSRILCDNSDNIELMQPLAFATAQLANKRAACKTGNLIPRVSLDPWRDSKIWI